MSTLQKGDRQEGLYVNSRREQILHNGNKPWCAPPLGAWYPPQNIGPSNVHFQTRDDSLVLPEEYLT